MKYRIFETESEAAEASQAVYAGLVRERAALFGGLLERWNGVVVPVNVTEWADSSLTGNKFPIYGHRASDNQTMKQEGHTTSWATPQQIADGRWVIPSPDDEGEVPGDDWWPEPIHNEGGMA
jgi:hypothetical protein